MVETSSHLSDLSRKVRFLLNIRDVLGTSFCGEVGCALSRSLESTDWIPAELMEPQLSSYRRSILYEDPTGFFAIAALTWAPGQATPIHDHQTWGAVGIVAGALRSETYVRQVDGELVKRGPDEVLVPGAVVLVQPVHPTLPDIHRLSSVTDEVSLSIHVYGCRLSEINRNLYPTQFWQYPVIGL